MKLDNEEVGFNVFFQEKKTTRKYQNNAIKIIQVIGANWLTL
jgi:hypothetical protein